MKFLRPCPAMIMMLVSIILLASAPASAALPTSSIITSRERSVYISFSAGEGCKEAAVIKARLQQDVHVLEHVFLSMQKTGKLNSRYPLLLFRIKCRPDDTSGIAPLAAELSFTPAVALVSAFSSRGYVAGASRTERLGRAYVIETTLTTFKDLLALVMLLPRLGEQSPSLAVKDEGALNEVKNSREYKAFSKIRLEFGPPVINWGSPENRGLLPVWEAGAYFYHLYDQAGKKLFELKPLDYYLARPSWSQSNPLLLAAATETDLYFVEPPSGKTHRLDLTALFPQRYLQMTDLIALAINLREKQIYITLDRNLPDEFWQTERHTYRFALDTGEISIAERSVPRETDQTPVQPPASGTGAISEFVSPSAGDVSFVHQLFNNRQTGWQYGQLSRHEGYLDAYWAGLLPKDSPFVFRPVRLVTLSRFLAYGSQTELVLFDVVRESYHSLSLNELRPADYNEITAVRFAQNPSNVGDKIYFSLEGLNASLSFYVWDIMSGRATQVEDTLENRLDHGWQEFQPGAANYVLPYGSMLLSGNEAKGASTAYYLSLVTGALLSLSSWLLLLFLAYGLPFVLAHTLTFLAAIKLKSSRMLLSCGPAMITVLFAALSILAIRLTLPYGDLIKGLVYPLPWFYHLGSSAGVIFMAGFITVVTAVLTILVFNNARTMFQAFFPGASAAHPDRKSIVFSASAIYGLAGAILILLLFLLAAVTLPYYQWPKGLDVLLFVAMVYVLCLAATFYLLWAKPAAAGYLAAAAAFLGVGYVAFANINIIRLLIDNEHSLQVAVSRLAVMLPLTLICMVYLARRELVRRGRMLKLPAAIVTAALTAVPATAVIVYGELLPLFMGRLGNFALPAAVALLAITFISIIAALVLVFFFPSQEPVPARVMLPVTAAPAAIRFRLPFGLAVVGVAALLVIFHLVMERSAGISFSSYLGWLLLAAILYLAVAPVFYLGRLLTDRLASIIFTPERVG